MRRFAIIQSENPTKIEKRAIAHLSELLLNLNIEYPICISKEEEIPEGYTSIRFTYDDGGEKLSCREEYRITVKDEKITVCGYDGSGLLYGAIDLYQNYLNPFRYVNATNENYSRFDEPLPDYTATCRPSVSERGIWTWGHVIYDWRGFIDNMVKLKLNSIIIWNDHVPFNIDEILDYAHESGISVILGYPWGWDQKCRELSLSALDGLGERIYDRFIRSFSHLDIDGIYFQTITELDDENLGGRLVAEVVTDFVNDTVKRFYESHPDLLIEFGLHATSVKNRLDFITKVDKRVRIVWEDMGSMPFAYNANDINNYEETKALAERCAALRGTDDNFGVVTKAVCCLDWKTFVHPAGPQNVGVSSKVIRDNRIARKARVMRLATSGWILNGEYALDTVRALVKAKSGDLSVNALVEDGMFGERIPYSIALFSEMLWDSDADYRDIVKRISLLDHVEF